MKPPDDKLNALATVQREILAYYGPLRELAYRMDAGSPSYLFHWVDHNDVTRGLRLTFQQLETLDLRSMIREIIKSDHEVNP